MGLLLICLFMFFLICLVFVNLVFGIIYFFICLFFDCNFNLVIKCLVLRRIFYLFFMIFSIV